MAKRYQASSTNVEDYWQLFVNRRAYVLQSMRPHAESGRYYYFRPKARKNGDAPSLTAETIRRHLEGDLTIGVYAMSLEPDDEQLDESVRSATELYPQQALAAQPTVDDTVGSGPRRWSFGQHLIVAGVIAIVVILVLLGHRYY